MSDEVWDDAFIRRKLTEFASQESDFAHPLLNVLRPEELDVIQRRIGLQGWQPSSIPQVARQLGLNRARVRQLESVALSKLRHPSHRQFWKRATESVEVTHALESLANLTPELIDHLKSHSEDLLLIPPEVFEHLVAELLASAGFDEVALVGRSPDTSADILAGFFAERVGLRFRVFVEVKRWRDRIGVEVFNQVLGAMVSERPRFGWHSAMIVALGGATDTRKFSGDEWRLKGLEVKDRKDLLAWLNDYRPTKEGLWVPKD